MAEKIPESTALFTEEQLLDLNHFKLNDLLAEVDEVQVLAEAVRAEKALAKFIEDDLRRAAEGSTGWLAGELRKKEAQLASVRAFIIEHTKDPLFLNISDLQRIAEREGSVNAVRQARIMLERIQSVPGEIEEASKQAIQFTQEQWLESKVDVEQYITDLESFIKLYAEDVQD